MTSIKAARRALADAWWFVRAHRALHRAATHIQRDGVTAATDALARPWRRGSRALAPADPRLHAIDRAIERASRWQWRRVDCLPRSLAAYQLLRSVGARPVLTVGVRAAPFAAHAWTEVAGRGIGDELTGAHRATLQVIDRRPAVP